MPRTVSEIKRIMESEGTAWTPELRAYAIANGAVDDAPKPKMIGDEFFSRPDVRAQEQAILASGADGPLDIPLADRVVNAFARGASFGLIDPIEPQRQASSGVPFLDKTLSDATIGGADLLGMIAAVRSCPARGWPGRRGERRGWARERRSLGSTEPFAAR